MRLIAASIFAGLALVAAAIAYEPIVDDDTGSGEDAVAIAQAWYATLGPELTGLHPRLARVSVWQCRPPHF